MKTGRDDATEHDADAEKADYAHRLDVVAAAAQALTPSGDFFTSGTVSCFPTPGIHVTTYGDVQLPVTESVASRLWTHAPFCTAPYTQPTRSIRLAAHEFCTRNPAWSPFVWQLVNDRRMALGLSLNVQILVQPQSLHIHGRGTANDNAQWHKTDPRSFGRLVIVVPSAFQGGAVTVRGPRPSSDDFRVWNPAAEDLLALKYALLYDSCHVAWTRLTDGARVCLVYELVAVTEGPDHVPSFDRTRTRAHATARVFRDALDEFFKLDTKNSRDPKRQRLGEDIRSWAIARPERHRKTTLVYILSDPYTGGELSFEQLKPADTLLATRFIEWCSDGRDMFTLLLCEIQFDFREFPDLDDDDESRFDCPIISILRYEVYSDHRDETSPDGLYSELSIDLATEVAPVRFFEGDRFPSNRSGTTFTSVCLVVVPYVATLDALFWRRPVQALEKWRSLASRSRSLAIRAATLFSRVPRDWSMTTPKGEAVLATVMDLGSADTLQNIVLSCEHIAFQPKLREIATRFKWSTLVEIVKTVCVAQRDRYDRTAASTPVNLVASLLDSETDATKIAPLLDHVTSYPQWAANVPQDALVRVLGLALRVSPDCLLRMARIDDLSVCVYGVLPALRALVEPFVLPDAVTCPPGIQTVLRAMLDHVNTGTARLLQDGFTRWSMTCPHERDLFGRYMRSDDNIGVVCAVCAQVAHFLRDEHATQLTLSAFKLDHATASWRLCPQYMKKNLTVQRVSSGGKALLTKTCDGPLFVDGGHEAQVLEELLGKFEKKGLAQTKSVPSTYFFGDQHINLSRYIGPVTQSCSSNNSARLRRP